MAARYQRQDRFFRQAKKDAFVARSVYKLQELDKRFSLFRRGDVVLDLGCAPGSWLQYIARAVGKKGLVLGYDIAEPSISLSPHVRAFQEDVALLTSEGIEAQRLEAEQASGLKGSRRFDVVASDMAPKLTGIRDADQAKSIALATHALNLAEDLLPEGKAFIAKVFQGRDTDAFLNRIRARFGPVKLIRPEATREGSREAFVFSRRRA